MKHINLSFQRLLWKMFHNCTYFPQNPMLWHSVSFFLCYFLSKLWKSATEESVLRKCPVHSTLWMLNTIQHLQDTLQVHYSHIFKERNKQKKINATIEKASLHIAHFTWGATSHLRVSLTLHSGESGVFCWASQFVSSKCFSVKKQQQFLDSCPGKIFYSITLKISFRETIKHFICEI